MYNRYIPQGDGSYRRSRVQEPEKTVQPPKEAYRPSHPSPPPEQPTVCQNCVHAHPVPRPVPPRPQRTAPPVGIGTFLKNLLPRDFDTEDLIIVLLLLLMAGDCKEDQNSALLTLVLYLFL